MRAASRFDVRRGSPTTSKESIVSLMRTMMLAWLPELTDDSCGLGGRQS